jgi:hypothetical protein
MNDIDKINLSQNRMSDIGITTVLKNISKNTFIIDLSYNYASQLTCKHLSSLSLTPYF